MNATAVSNDAGLTIAHHVAAADAQPAEHVRQPVGLVLQSPKV